MIKTKIKYLCFEQFYSQESNDGFIVVPDAPKPVTKNYPALDKLSVEDIPGIVGSVVIPEINAVNPTGKYKPFGFEVVRQIDGKKVNLGRYYFADDNDMFMTLEMLAKKAQRFCNVGVPSTHAKVSNGYGQALKEFLENKKLEAALIVPDNIEVLPGKSIWAMYPRAGFFLASQSAGAVVLALEDSDNVIHRKTGELYDLDPIKPFKRTILNKGAIPTT